MTNTSQKKKALPSVKKLHPHTLHVRPVTTPFSAHPKTHLAHLYINTPSPTHQNTTLNNAKPHYNNVFVCNSSQKHWKQTQTSGTITPTVTCSLTRPSLPQ